jgi:glutamine cyclotransferase
MKPASHPPHTLWKLLRDSHIPAPSTIGYVSSRARSSRTIASAKGLYRMPPVHNVTHVPVHLRELAMPRNTLRAALVLALALMALGRGFAAESYRVVRAYPHDQQAFTQGLVYLDGHLYESTGIEGKSSLREEDLESGRIFQFHDVPGQYFAEGLTDWGSTLIQLTWKSHLALVYDRGTFRFLRSFPVKYEGWGLTHDASNLILSDGTATLHFFNPGTFQETRSITVKDHGKTVTQLNELEFIHGEIYANVWHSDRIARIAPSTGKVLDWIDLTGLLAPTDRSNNEAVLNGIAYDAAHDRLFVTGKLWPKVFEIKVVPSQSRTPDAAKSHPR